MEQETETVSGATGEGFSLFSKRRHRNAKHKPHPPEINTVTELSEEEVRINKEASALVKSKEDGERISSSLSFSELGLSEWAVQTCKELGMQKPTPVQSHCIPQILAGHDVVGLAQTGSGKTAAFALPILHRLAEEPFGIFALVITPTRELAFQLAEHFRALGSAIHIRCTVVVGGLSMLSQAQALMKRPHVVISTPGRIKELIQQNPNDFPPLLSKAKFLVLDEADRVLDAGFEEELRVVFQCLPPSRQTLLFSATMTDDLRELLHCPNKPYFYEEYNNQGGFTTVETLKQHYIFMPSNVKEVYLFHILSKMGDMGIRSTMIFVSKGTCCHLLSLLLEALDQEAAALHSFNSQSLRLSALHRFKSRQVSILLATDVASRGLDIPSVDLVINYDVPRYATDYVHRVGRTARAGRGGLAISFVTEKDIELVHEIENTTGKRLEIFECKENEVLANITKVYKARRVAKMKMLEDGFEEKVKERQKQKRRALAEKGLLNKTSKKKKRSKSTEQETL